MFHMARLWGRICTWRTGCPLRIEGLDTIDLRRSLRGDGEPPVGVGYPGAHGHPAAEMANGILGEEKPFRDPSPGLGHAGPRPYAGGPGQPRDSGDPGDQKRRPGVGRQIDPRSFPKKHMARAMCSAAFRRGGFVLALKTGMPILPVGIRGTRTAMPPNGRLLAPSEFTVRFGEPIATARPDNLRPRSPYRTDPRRRGRASAANPPPPRGGSSGFIFRR